MPYNWQPPQAGNQHGEGGGGACGGGGVGGGGGDHGGGGHGSGDSEAASATRSGQCELARDQHLAQEMHIADQQAVMSLCSVSADAAAMLLATSGSVEQAVAVYFENPDPATVMTACSVSADVARMLLSTSTTAHEAIERHLENPDRSTVMTACLVPADVASTLVATHGSAHEAIAFHSENPGYLDLVFAPHVPFAQRQRVFAYNLSVTDHFTRKLLYLALGPDGLPLSPAKHRAQIVRPLPLVKASWFFFLNTLGMKRCSGQQPPPHDCSYTIAEYSSDELLRCMFGCVGYISRRLTAAAGGTWMRWGCEKWVVDRVIRGRSGNVQVQ